MFVIVSIASGAGHRENVPHLVTDPIRAAVKRARFDRKLSDPTVPLTLCDRSST
jgi:hypothetical protein